MENPGRLKKDGEGRDVREDKRDEVETPAGTFLTGHWIDNTEGAGGVRSSPSPRYARAVRAYSAPRIIHHAFSIIDRVASAYRELTFTYPKAIAELPPFSSGDSSQTLVNRVDPFGRATGQSYGYYDFNCGGFHQDLSAAFWQNNAILNPGLCLFTPDERGFATALNGAGDVCGYNGSNRPIAWPDGANSATYPITLSTPGFTTGYTSDMNTDSTIIGYAYSGATVHVPMGEEWEQLASARRLEF